MMRGLWALMSSKSILSFVRTLARHTTADHGHRLFILQGASLSRELGYLDELRQRTLVRPSCRNKCLAKALAVFRGVELRRQHLARVVECRRHIRQCGTLELEHGEQISVKGLPKPLACDLARKMKSRSCGRDNVPGLPGNWMHAGS